MSLSKDIEKHTYKYTRYLYGVGALYYWNRHVNEIRSFWRNIKNNVVSMTIIIIYEPHIIFEVGIGVAMDFAISLAFQCGVSRIYLME